MKFWHDDIFSIRDASHGDVQTAAGQSVCIIRQTAPQCDLQPLENIHRGTEKTERMLFGKSRKLQKLVSNTSCEKKEWI